MNYKISNTKISDVDIERLVQEIIRDSPPCKTISCLNAHIFNLAQTDRQLREDLNNSDMVCADGMAIVWASRLLGIPLKERCNMTEAFRAFLESSNMPSTKAVLIGCSDSEIESGIRSIHSMSLHCKIVAGFSGYFECEQYKELLRDFTEVDFVFIGCGTPKSERLVQLISGWYSKPIVWHIGGGTIKMLAGTMIEAPPWMRNSGLQWLHRLVSEPTKLWKRYVMGNPLFVWNIIVLYLKRVFKKD